MKLANGNHGIKVMTMLVPDLMADLIPSKSAAGVNLGEHFDMIQKKIGSIEWYDRDAKLAERLTSSSGWIGVTSRCGIPGGPYTIIRSLVYMDAVVCLEFEESSRLYRICVGNGYAGNFVGVRPGDRLRFLEESFDILFNDVDDEFLLVRDKKILDGISFLTDFRASLENVPEQVIQYISIHDWSLR
jgi:hypothetical protein